MEDLLAREQALRAANAELDSNVQAVQAASAALHESVVARTNAGGWAGVDLGDDADAGAAPVQPQQQRQPSQLPTVRDRAKQAALAEERALAAVRAARQHTAEVSDGVAAAAGGAVAGGGSRIPTFRGGAGGRGAARAPATAGAAGTDGDGSTPAPAVVSTETDVYLDPDLPLDAQVKLLRSHLRVARHELAEARAVAAGASAEAGEAKKQAAAAAEERARLNRAVTAAEAALDKARKAATSAEAREGDLRAQLAHLNKEQAGKERQARQAETSSAALDARIARAQEEVDRLKAQLASERAQAGEAQAGLGRQVEALQLALKRTERQRNDLLVAFKKSVRLIAVLKRQKLHVEAARLLAFTEEEFAKAMGV